MPWIMTLDFASAWAALGLRAPDWLLQNEYSLSPSVFHLPRRASNAHRTHVHHHRRAIVGVT